MTIQSMVVTKDNVEATYQEAARLGNIKQMFDIDNSELCIHISPDVRTQCILSVLPLAPDPIVQYYLYVPLQGISQQMRADFLAFAVSKRVIDYTPGYTVARTKDVPPEDASRNADAKPASKLNA